MRKGLNIEQAKRDISIVSYLAAHGHQPVGMQGKEHKYLSPFRKEKTPSMFVNDETGQWNDFGFDRGDIIRLAQTLHSFSSVSETLRHLSAFVSGAVVHTIAQPERKSLFERPQSSITNVRPRFLNHFVLLKYLREERGISKALAQKYLKLILYDNKGRKDLFSIGWENDSGAFEIRSAGVKNFKAVTGSKNLTTIIQRGEGNRCFVFESMLDFLSVLEIKKVDALEGTIIILNSTALVKRAAALIDSENFDTIFTLLDNDKGGKDALELLKELTRHSDIRPQTFYDGYNDVNDFLIGKKAS